MTDEFFNAPEESDFANHRKAVRYSSISSKAIITLRQLFRGKKYIKARIVDLSARGARISTRYKLPKDAIVIFNLKMDEKATVWKIPAKIVRTYSYSEFGIVFDSLQNTLIDEIVRNETGITIK